MRKDAAALEIFHSFAKIKVGNGEKVFFWLDRWVNGRRIQEIAPKVFALIPTRKKNCRRVADALADNRWVLDLPSLPDQLDEEGCVQCIRLWMELQIVQRDSRTSDEFSWTGSKSGLYNARDTYKLLCQGRQFFSLSEPIWRSFAPPKCKMFCWLAAKGRLWTSDRRFRHGLQDQTSACFVCLQEEDNIEHITMQCCYARQVWHTCLHAAGLRIPIPHVGSIWENWWLHVRTLVAAKDRRKIDTLIILVAWTLWKHRNAVVFGNTRDQCSPTQLADRVRDEFRLWELAGFGGSRSQEGE
jgi:hypothetical protein